MKITRRWFIGGAASAAIVPGRMFALAAGLPTPGTVRVKFGVLSDVHLNREGDEKYFMRALEFFRDNGADGVMIAGDIADTGRIDQLARCARCWYRTFPDGKAPDGRPVEQLFVYGNHDVDGWTWIEDKSKLNDPAVRAASIGADDNRAKAWKELFHEDYAPIWRKTVKGYTFLGGHWGGDRGIEEYMKAHGKDIDPSLPFFYAQHAHPKDTCIGSWAWGHDDGLSTRAFTPFPNAVTFSGHSHYSLTDERSVWQGAFTSINTSSMRYSSTDYNLRDNMPGNGWGYKAWRPPRTNPVLGTRDGNQGMLVTVTDEVMRIERREFHFGTESLGDDWVIPLGTAVEKRPFAFAPRAAKRAAPAFAKDAEVGVAFLEGEPKKDKAPEVKGRLVKVTFPAAAPVEKCRVFEYEVTATLVEDDVDLVVAQRRVMAPDFHLPASKCGRPGSCAFALADLPKKGHVRFSVRPVECFGRKGAEIVSDLVSLPEV